MTSRALLCVTCCVVALSTMRWSCVGWTSDRLDPSDLVGTWRADYDEDYFGRRCWYTVTGLETLTLRADGTYRQVYDDGRGYVYTSPWNNWHLDEYRGSSILHLEGGRFYPLGIEDAEKMARGELLWSAIDYTGGRIDLDGSEVLLYAYGSPAAAGGTHLRHLQVCDPDAPAIVDFYLETAPGR